jgi:hypothetical protein
MTGVFGCWPPTRPLPIDSCRYILRRLYFAHLIANPIHSFIQCMPPPPSTPGCSVCCARRLLPDQERHPVAAGWPAHHSVPAAVGGVKRRSNTATIRLQEGGEGSGAV